MDMITAFYIRTMLYLREPKRDEKGATTLEYAVIAAVIFGIAVALTAAISTAVDSYKGKIHP